MTTENRVYHILMKAFFGSQAQEKAKETKFVQRQSPLTGPLFLQALVWTVYLYGEITLGAVADTAEDLAPACQVSEQAVEGRFNQRAVAFLQAMFRVALQQTIPQPAMVAPLLSAFSAVYLLDSSTVCLPDSLKDEFAGCGGAGAEAAAKLYLLLDWLRGQVAALQVRDGRKADQNMGQEFLAGTPVGALWIFDLGFWHLAFLAALGQMGSYFLSRLSSSVALSLPLAEGQTQRFDVDQFLNRALRDRTFEIAVLLGAQHRLPVRLICVPVPPPVANQRRRRAREDARRQGRTPKKHLLRRLNWTLLVTNAPLQRLPTSTVDTVYRVRWQVELAFKLAKSEAGLERTNATKPQRVLCEFYAKLIALLWFHRLMGVLPESPRHSYPKVWRRLRARVLRYGQHLPGRTGQTELIHLLQYLDRRARTGSRRKYPSTLQRLERVADTASICCLLDPVAYVKQKRRADPHFVAQFFVVSAVTVYPAAA